MKKFLSKLSLFLAPLLVLATRAWAANAGLLKDIPEDPGKIQFCHFFVLLKNFVDFLMFQLGPLMAVFYLAWMGFLWVTSGEDPSNIQKTKGIFKAIFTGFIIMFAAWLVVGLFMMVIGTASWTGLQDGWYKMKCQ